MQPTTAVAIYFLIWWITLFAILPWGVRSQEESGDVVPGTDPGAPGLPRLVRKLLWTTLVASVLFALCWAIYKYKLITLEDFPAVLSPPSQR
jgi:predicted secreted protein